MRNSLQTNFPKSKWIDSETRVAREGRCCGCGVCASVCPIEKCISINFNIYKQYVPIVNHNICINCGLCLQVCPDNQRSTLRAQKTFRESHPNLNYNKLIGSFTACYVGHTTCELDRLSSASGGVLTALLQEILNSGEADAVALAVRSNYKLTGKFFEAKLVTSAEEVGANRGSKYYPIEYSKLLQTMKLNSLRYVVVALPCVTTAIRKAQYSNSRLSQNIRFILTPVCGHNVSAFYTEYLLRTNGIDLSSVIRLCYRDKEETRTANNYKLAIEYRDRCGETKIKRLSFLNSNVGKTWNSCLFSLDKCMYCTDFAGELSDASFADAWLPQYTSDPRGASLIIIRNSCVERLIKNLTKCNKLKLTPISEDLVINANMSSFYQKKELIKGRIRLQKSWNKDFPDYGVAWKTAKLQNGLSENLKLWLHVNLSRRLYKNGLLMILGTERFLKLVDTPINWLVRIMRRILGKRISHSV